MALDVNAPKVGVGALGRGDMLVVEASSDIGSDGDSSDGDSSDGDSSDGDIGMIDEIVTVLDCFGAGASSAGGMVNRAGAAAGTGCLGVGAGGLSVVIGAPNKRSLAAMAMLDMRVQ